MPPASESLHIDRYLTNISEDFAQDEENFVHNTVFPVVPVRKQSDKYVIYDRGDYYHGDLPERPLGGELKTVDWGSSEGTYRCVERGLAHKIDDRERANVDDPIDLRERAMAVLMRNAMVHRDQQWASTYFTTGVWTTDRDGSGSDFTQFDDSSSTPIELIDSEKDTIELRTYGFTPNTLVVGTDVHNELRTHSNIRDYVKYTQGGVPTAEVIASLFGVDNYVRAKSVENTADRGQTESAGRIFDSKSMLLAYSPESAGLNQPAAGYTFAWTGLLEGAANAMGGVILSDRIDRQFSDWFGLRIAQDINLVSADLGTFFHNVNS